MKSPSNAATLFGVALRIRTACKPAILALPALFLPSAPAFGAPGENALETINRFLAESAATTPAYRADLQRATDPSRVPDGRLSGFSSLIGSFTYRPKTYAELTQAERVELLRDGRFRDYLLAMGRPFRIAPEDMLRPGSLPVELDPP
jgi:hypothetical protein